MINALFSILRKLGYLVFMRKKGEKGYFSKDGATYLLSQKGAKVRAHMLVKAPEDADSTSFSEDQSVALPYIEIWNKEIQKAGVSARRIPESTAGLFEPNVLEFEQSKAGGTPEIFQEAISELLTFPHFRGETGKRPLQFKFILNPRKLEKFLSGDYFDGTKEVEIKPQPVKAPPTPVERIKKKVLKPQKVKATPEVIIETPMAVDTPENLEKIKRFNQQCKKHYPKPNVDQLSDQKKIEVMEKLPTNQAFKLTCQQAQKSVKKDIYLPKASNFFDANYSKTNYLQFAPEPKPTGVLTKNRDRKLLKKLLNTLKEEYPLRAEIFSGVDIRISPEQKLVEIRGEEFYLQWLQDNHFDVKIQRILMRLTGERFSVAII